MSSLVRLILNGSSVSLQITKTAIKASMVLQIGQILIVNYGVYCNLASKKSMYNAVSTLAPSFSIGSSSFLQVTRRL